MYRVYSTMHSRKKILETTLDYDTFVAADINHLVDIMVR